MYYGEKGAIEAAKTEEGDAGEAEPADISTPEHTPGVSSIEKKLGAAALDWLPRPPKIPDEALPGFEDLGPADGDPDHIFRSIN